MEYKKACKTCGKIFEKPYNCSVKAFKNRTVYCSKECMHVSGENNCHFVGEKIKKDSIHVWVSKVWGRPNKCDICGTTEAKSFNWSNKNHTYKRKKEDWQFLCKKCHTKYDMENNGYNPAGHFKKFEA